jgi:hypothetical protein
LFGLLVLNLQLRLFCTFFWGCKIGLWANAARLAPRAQVLLSLPHMTLAALAEFEGAVGGTNSIKEQRLAVRHLLQGGAGGQLRALHHQKAGTLVTNLTGRPREAGNLVESKERR